MNDSNKVESLRKILEQFSGKRVLVIGDLMWDEYIQGSCTRISPEAPVPVVLSERESRMPGGATNVLKNLVDLNISAGIMGVVGADTNGHQMIQELKGWNLNTVEIWESPDRPTTIKTRILAQHQQLIRLDREYAKPISESLEKKMLQVLEQIVNKFQAIILSDYDKGVLTPGLIQGIIRIAHRYNVFVSVDPQVRHFQSYESADIMTPNEKEASAAIGADFPENEEETIAIGKQILADLKLKHLLITRSEKGMALFEQGAPVRLIPTVAKEVYDVTGAGDTVVAVFTAAVAAGSTLIDAALLANIAGGIVVGKLGTATASNEELQSAIRAEYTRYTERAL